MFVHISLKMQQTIIMFNMRDIKFIYSWSIRQSIGRFDSEHSTTIPDMKSYCLKTALITIFKIFLLISNFVSLGKNACSFNIRCDKKCKNRICEYDPSTNGYYNTSISTDSPGYHGQGCCQGCQYPDYQDHYFDVGTKSCFQGTCPKDANGVQQYWNVDNTCRQDCSADFNHYRNPVTGACQYFCSKRYYRDNTNKLCVANCPNGQYKYNSTSAYFCTIQCLNPYPYANIETGFCQSTCTKGYGDITTKKCVSFCPNNMYKYEKQKICVQDCSPLGWSVVLDITTNTCISIQDPSEPSGPSGPSLPSLPSGSSGVYYNIIITQTFAIIIGAAFLVLAGAIITCIVYSIRKIRARKSYVEIPMNLTSEHINVQYNQ